MSSPPRKNGKHRADGSEIQNEIISLTTPDVDEDPSVAEHAGVVCSGSNCTRSGKWIHGVRYKCSVCKQQDFCSSCVGQPDNGHEGSHPLYECIGPSEFIEARRLTTGELIFTDTPADGAAELLAMNNLYLNGQAKQTAKPSLPSFPLRYLPKSYCGLSLGNVEHYQDAALLAKVILGRITKYEYKGCQLRDFPGARPAVARLLELKPGNPADKIDCQLRLTRLDDVETYEVLCCKWSDLIQQSDHDDIADILSTGRKHAVYVNDEYFLDTSTTVFEALRAARDPEKTKLLWIEELCVDTAHEKRFQNRSRGLIMDSASEVIMWAGDGYDGVEDAIGLLTMLLHHCKDDGRPSLPTPDQMAELDLPPLGSDDWQSLFQLIPRAVAKFHWQLEDISFARNAVLQCGGYRFDWWDVVSILKMLAQDEWNEHLTA